MADDLAMAAGDLALVPRQEGMIKTNARFRTQGIWLNGPAKGVKNSSSLSGIGNLAGDQVDHLPDLESPVNPPQT